MADNTNVTIHINGNTSGLDKAVGKATEDFDKLHQSVKKTSDEGNNLPSISKKLDMGNLMEASESLSGIGDGIIEIGTKSIEAAGKAQAMQAQFQQVFGGLAGEAQKSVNSMAEKFGMLPNTVKPIFTQYTSMFKGLGMSTEDAMKKAGDATTMAADAAAFYDKSMDEASSGLNSFIKGNYEGGESIGLFANDTQMAAFAVSQGVVGATKDWASLDEATKQATRLEYAKNMQEQAGAVGQAARESDGLENQMGRAKQALEDFYASIGKDILPTFIKVLQSGVKVIQNMAKWWGQLDQPMKIFIGSIAGIIAALTTLAPIITAIVTVVGTFGAGVLLPMIGIIAGIAAAIAVVVTVVQNWGTITDWISEKWSAFVDWLGGIWDSIKETASNLWEGVKDKWGSFIDWVSDKWNGLKEWFSSFWGGLTEGASNIWQGVQETWQTFIDWVSNIWNGVKEVWSIIWADIVGIVQIPWTLITSLIQAGINIIVGIFDVAGQLLGAAWQAVWTPISDFLKNICDTMTQWISIAWNGIVTTFHTIFDPVVAWWNGIWTSISTTASNIWNSISATASSIWNSIKNTITSLVQAAATVIQNVWSTVSSWLGGIWNSISSTASNIWNSITSSISNAINAAKSAIQSVWNTISSWISGIWNGIKNTALNLWNGITSTISSKVNDGKNAISSGWSNLTSIVSGIFNNVKSAIANIWEGIKKTVSAPIDWIRDKISGIFDNLNISIPHIPLPHFKLSGEFNPLKGKIPSLDVNWYAKGGVFTKPTLLGGMNGVGEAGPEAVLPLRDNVLAKIGNQILRATGVTAPNQETNSTVNNYNVVVNVDGDQSTSLTDRVTDSVVKGITKVQIRESRAWS